MAARDPSSHRKLSLRDRTRAKFDSLLRSIDKQQSKKASKKSPKKTDDESVLQRNESSSLSSDSSETTTGYINPIYQDDQVPKSKKSSRKSLESESTSNVSKSGDSQSVMEPESSINTEEDTGRQNKTASEQRTVRMNFDDDSTPESLVQRTIRESVWEKTMNVNESNSALSISNGSSLPSKSTADFIILEREPPEKPYEHDIKGKSKKKVKKQFVPTKDTSHSDSMAAVQRLGRKQSNANGDLDGTSSSVLGLESSVASESVESNDALMSVWWKGTSSVSTNFDKHDATSSLEMTNLNLTNTARQKRRARKQQSVNQLSEGEAMSTVTLELSSPQRSESSHRSPSDTSTKYDIHRLSDTDDHERYNVESSTDPLALSHKTVPKKHPKALTNESQGSFKTASSDLTRESVLENDDVSRTGGSAISVIYKQTNSPSTSSDVANIVERRKTDRPTIVTTPAATQIKVPEESSDSDSANGEVLMAVTSVADIEQPATAIVSTTDSTAKVKEKKNEKSKQKKKKKVKTKLSEETVAADQETGDEPVFSEMLGVLIHRVDGLKMNLLICHPVVQVHIFDINSGNYLQKKHQQQPVASFYEGQSSPIKHIMAVMTQPYHMSGKENLIPEWQELLIFNEDYNYFIQEEPPVILFFEILDFVSMSQASRQYKYLGKDGGWCRIAWAFLKLVGANSVLNVGKRLRLQLYYPPKTKWGSACIPSAAKEVYSWWRRGLKKKYPYTLFVTVKPVTPPEVHPGLRSLIPTQEERGRETLEELEKNLKEGKTIVDTHITDAKTPSDYRWSRLPGQACKIPETLHLSLQACHSGCFVVRFSRGGRFLACGSVDGDSYPLLIFEIPSGKPKGKLMGHFGIIYDIVWFPDDKTIISVSADCTLRLWDFSNDECESSVMLPHPSYVYAATCHPTTSNIIVSGCYDNIVRVWRASISECELLQELTGHKSFINSVCFDEDGNKFYSGDGIGVLCVWSNGSTSKRKKKVVIKDWSLLQEVKLDELKGISINDIIRHPGGHRLLISSRDNCIRLVDPREFTVLHLYKGFQNLNDHMHCCLTPCGTFVFTGSEDGTIHVWRTNTEEQAFKYTKLRINKTITTVDYHPQEHMLACCAYGERLPVLVFKHMTLAPPTLQLSESTDSILTSTATVKPSSESSVVAGKPPSGILKHKLLSNESIAVEQPSVTSDASVTDSPSSATRLPTVHHLPFQDVGLATAERQRTVKFEDEVTPPTKWSDMFAKIDAVLAFSSGKREPSKYLPPLKFDSSTPITSKSVSSAPSMLDTVSSWGSTFDQDSIEEFSMQSSLENSKVVALYAYTAASDDHLSLEVGDQILVLRKINDDWWYGRDCHGKNGLFPANYVFPAEDAQSGSSSPTPGLSSSTLTVPSRTPKRRTKRTHAIPSRSGSRPVFVSGSEDEEYTA